MSKKLISLIIPVYNESEVLPKLLDRLNIVADNSKSYDFEFLFINDGSNDNTLSILKDESIVNNRISFLNLSRQHGKELAMAAGIDNAEGDAVIIIDADLQDPPELIPEMIEWWTKGYDDIYARRKSRKGETMLKKLTSSCYYYVLQKSTRITIQRDTGDFRLLDRRCILALRKFKERDRNSKALFSWIGYKKKELLYDRDPRAAGQTKWNYLKLIHLAIDGITSFTTAPLRLATILGFITAFIALIYLIFWIILRTLIFGIDAPGYPSLMAVILFFGSAQLISLGIIGEYIGRIFNETKQRPLYLIEEQYFAKTRSHKRK
jgi:glycosyltransferase involved in cell wall biosynthesis